MTRFLQLRHPTIPSYSGIPVVLPMKIVMNLTIRHTIDLLLSSIGVSMKAVIALTPTKEKDHEESSRT
jgi:hypothetical protein